MSKIIKEFTFIKDLKIINGNVPGVYFDTFGEKPNFINSKINKSIRPFIIFYSNDYYYYLKCRSARNSFGNLKTKFNSEVFITGSKNSNIVPEKDSFIRTDQIFRISEKDLKQIVDFNSPKFKNTKSLLDGDFHDNLTVKKIKTALLDNLGQNPPQIALTAVFLNNNEFKAKPLYASRLLLEIDMKNNHRSNELFTEILDKINVKNLPLVISLFCQLIQEYANDNIEFSKNTIEKSKEICNSKITDKSLDQLSEEDKVKQINIKKNINKFKL